MVIYDLDVRCRAIQPAEADAPLVIEADAPLAIPISGEPFQAVAGRDAEEIEGYRCVQLFQLALCRSLHILRQLAGKAAMKEFLGFLAGECLDHREIVTLRDSVVKR